jgi:hypothetical protein
MKTKPVDVVEALLDEDLANLFPGDTGLKHVVWVSADPRTRHSRPRGKVWVDNRFYPFSLDDPIEWLVQPPRKVSSKDFARIQNFVRINRAVLLAHWRGEISSAELGRRLQKV